MDPGIAAPNRVLTSFEFVGTLLKAPESIRFI